MSGIAGTAPVRGHNLELEGLRGLAALMVLYCHLFAPIHDLDPGFSPSPRFWLIETGQGAVALFFVISGFVIGLTNNRPWSAPAAGDYLWRRFIRLVPLYLLAIAASVLVRPVDSPGTVAANLFFLQNPLPYGSWQAHLMEANTNLWSLNYEVLYYLVFLAVWRWRPPLPALIAFAGAVTAVGFFRPHLVAPIITTYAAGWAFWLAGLWLAWGVDASPAPAPQPWPSLLLLFIVSWKVKVLFYCLLHFHAPFPESGGPISLLELDFLPICLVLVAIATARSGRCFTLLRNFCLIMPLAYFAWRWRAGGAQSDHPFVLYTAMVAAAALLWRWRPSLEFFVRISITGFLCYGIYVFQRPAQWLVRDHLPWPAGTAESFALRVALTTALTLGAAWLGERRLQPWIRRRAEAWRRRGQPTVEFSR